MHLRFEVGKIVTKDFMYALVSLYMSKIHIRSSTKFDNGTCHFGLIFKILWSRHEKCIFQSISNAHINSTDGKSSQNWSWKWYGLLYFDQNFSRYFKLKLLLFCCLNTFSAFFVTLILYLQKFTSKYSKPYHFRDQCFELFPSVLFICAFEILWKILFSGLTIEF